MTNEVKFKEYMTVLGENHGKEISETLAGVYWKLLEPYEDEECISVFKRLILELRFFPKPADFTDLLRGSTNEMALAAWVKVVEAIRRFGNYRSVHFDDPVIHSCIEVMGGWPKLCEVLEDEVKWKQKEFERLYAVLSRRGKHPAYLPGTHEIVNANNGHEVESDIVRIGFSEKPKLIAGGE